MRFYPDAAMVHVNDVFSDTEAIAGAGVLIYTIEFAEWLEDDGVIL